MQNGIVIDWGNPWVIAVCILLAVCIVFGIVGIVRDRKAAKRRDRHWPGTGGF